MSRRFLLVQWSETHLFLNQTCSIVRLYYRSRLDELFNRSLEILIIIFNGIISWYWMLSNLDLDVIFFILRSNHVPNILYSNQVDSNPITVCTQIIQTWAVYLVEASSLDSILLTVLLDNSDINIFYYFSWLSSFLLKICSLESLIYDLTCSYGP